MTAHVAAHFATHRPDWVAVTCPGSVRPRSAWRRGSRLICAGFFIAMVVACAGDRPVVTEELLLEQIDTANGRAPAVPVEAEEPPTDAVPGPLVSSEPVPYEIIELDTYPHDPTAFTQGLLIEGDHFLESTGQPNETTLRRVNVTTGEVVQMVDAPDSSVWGEGLALVDDELIQLTYLAGIAYYWNAETFEFLGERTYEGEGWGLCYDGVRLIMTDGSDQLFFRDPESFEETGRISVTLNDAPLARLNELECVDGQVWANIFTTDIIVRIDPWTGTVNATVDASDLSQPRAPGSNVLNGIAYDETNDTFLLTGKDWPTMHRVQLVPAS